MFGVGVRCPENATLLGGPNYPCYIKINHLRLLMTKPSSLNGRLAKCAILLSQYEMQFLPQKAVKGQAWQIFWLSIQTQGDQTLWRSLRWSCWSLLNSDIFWRTSLATFLWRRVKNEPVRKYCSRSGCSICLPSELCDPSCILINRAMF